MLSRLSALFALMSLLFAAPALAQTSALTLAWDPSPEPEVAGYRVSYGTAPGSYSSSVDVGKETSYTVTGLTPGQRYYFTARSYTATGVTSAPAPEISEIAPAPAPVPGVVVLGLGSFAGDGGYFALRGGKTSDFGVSTWGRLPWEAYNRTGGGVRVATGDIDGDGANEVILGLGRGGNGYVAVLDDAEHNFALITWLQVKWDAYNAQNGETFPAVGDIDNDGRAEIVVGLGPGGQGWIEIFDDAAAGFAHTKWSQVPWADYIKRSDASTHPAIGDLDGDGASEIIVGLGKGSLGWFQILGSAVDKHAHRRWGQIQWSTYNAANGTTFPAAGDLDGDGRAEIVMGLGQGSLGWFQIFNHELTPLKWDKTNWVAYAAANGELHPAIGNMDDDPALEIVFGLGTFAGNGGWFQVLDDAAAGHAHLAWRNAGWTPFTAAGGALYPAILK